MPSRRFHSKTRHGCIKCKQRRIKCDVGLPKCGNCKKRGVVCEYADLDCTRMASSESSSPPCTIAVLGEAPASPPSVHTAFDELIHHYSTSVSLTVSTEPAIQQLWQTTFPSEAMSESYLWHGLLSVSMLHLLYLHKKSPTQMKSPALRHHSVALSSLRKCINSPIVENAGAVFALSMCVSLFTLGLGQTFPAESLDPIDEIIDIFSLIRGAQFITSTGSEWIQSSAFRVLVRLDDSESDAVPSEIHNNLEALKVCNDASLDDFETKRDYELALQTLERRFRTTDTAYAKNPGFIMVWANVFPRGFMDLLRLKKPLALVILGHFCVLLYGARGCWWIGTRGYQLLQAIEGNLDREWRSLLAWPKSVIGLA